jgi:hypothetical protein
MESGQAAGEASIKREVARRRTFAMISHPDAGKTTLTEKLLLLWRRGTRGERRVPREDAPIRDGWLPCRLLFRVSYSFPDESREVHSRFMKALFLVYQRGSSIASSSSVKVPRPVAPSYAPAAENMQTTSFALGTVKTISNPSSAFR